MSHLAAQIMKKRGEMKCSRTTVSPDTIIFQTLISGDENTNEMRRDHDHLYVRLTESEAKNTPWYV